MKIKLDENIPMALATYLRYEGYDVSTIPEENLSGATDSTVSYHATKEDRILVTFDMDFADIRNYPIGSHAGIIVFRINDQRWSLLKELVERLINSGTLERLHGSLAIVNEKQVRFRCKE